MSRKGVLVWVLTGSLLLPWPSHGRDFYMPEGTEVKLILHTSINTKINQEGDRLICTVQEPVFLEGIEVISAGSRVHGRIASIRKPRRFPSRGGQLVLAFDSIEVPGSGNVPIAGSLWDLYSPDEYADDEQAPNVDIGNAVSYTHLTLPTNREV